MFLIIVLNMVVSIDSDDFEIDVGEFLLVEDELIIKDKSGLGIVVVD